MEIWDGAFSLNKNIWNKRELLKRRKAKKRFQKLKKGVDKMMYIMKKTNEYLETSDNAEKKWCESIPHDSTRNAVYSITLDIVKPASKWNDENIQN